MTALLPFPTPNSIPHSALPPRRTGKVARLPKAIRDRINHLLDENLPYHTIIAQLGEAGQDLNPQNLSNWAQGGYQDYLRHQDTLDLFKDQLEFAKDLLAEVPDPSTIFQALRLMAGLQLSRVLFETGQKLAETDPAAYARLVRTICSLSSAERQYCQARLTQAPVPSAPAKPIDYTRPLTERETQLIRAKLDEMCGYPAEPAHPIKADQASTQPVGTSSTSSPIKSVIPSAAPIKPDQASVVEVRFQRAGEGGFQPLVPAPSASNPIKVDQASTHPVGTSSTSSPTTSAVTSASPFKPDQTSAVVPSTVASNDEGDAQPPVPMQPEASQFKVDQASGTNLTPSPTTAASASSIKAEQDATVCVHSSDSEKER